MSVSRAKGCMSGHKTIFILMAKFCFCGHKSRSVLMANDCVHTRQGLF